MAFQSSIKQASDWPLTSGKSEAIDRLNRYISISNQPMADNNAGTSVSTLVEIESESLWDELIGNFGEMRVISFEHLLNMTNIMLEIRRRRYRAV